MFIIPKDATDAEVAAMFSQAVQKHAQHDQSTHGNWADGVILDRGSYPDPDKDYTTGHQLVAQPYGEEHPVGTLQYNRDTRPEGGGDYRREVVITALWVKPEWRRKGVATAMLNKLRQEHRGWNVETDQEFTESGEKFWRAAVGDPGKVKRVKLPTPKLKDVT